MGMRKAEEKGTERDENECGSDPESACDRAREAMDDELELLDNELFVWWAIDVLCVDAPWAVGAGTANAVNVKFVGATDCSERIRSSGRMKAADVDETIRRPEPVSSEERSGAVVTCCCCCCCCDMRSCEHLRLFASG